MYARTATLFLAIVGTLLNATAATHLFTLWRAVRTVETDSEWEGSEKYPLDAMRIVWCLLSAYFSVSAVACAVGLIGVVRRIPSYVRLFRDYSVADLCLCASSTIVFAFASFRPAVRSAVCEELSRFPDLMRDLAEAGLNLENCETWFERAIIAIVSLTGVLFVIRLQFTLTISTYYGHLLRSNFNTVRLNIVRPLSEQSSSPLQRIYLLPNGRDHSPSTPSHKPHVVVYAPVSMNSEDARELDATEAWVTPSRRSHSLPQARHYRGRINLPVRPEEGLIPFHQDLKH